MERVLVVGCPGAGKSTAAKSLATKIGLPVIHLDYHHWQSGWVPSEKEVWREEVLSLAAQPRWIMDGDYGSTLNVSERTAVAVMHRPYPSSAFVTMVTVDARRLVA